MRYGVHLFNINQTNVFENAKTLGVPDTKTISEVLILIINAFYDERSRTITKQMLIIFHLDTQVQI